MLKNQRGISLISAVMIIVAIILMIMIGFVAYRVGENAGRENMQAVNDNNIIGTRDRETENANNMQNEINNDFRSEKFEHITERIVGGWFDDVPTSSASAHIFADNRMKISMAGQCINGEFEITQRMQDGTYLLLFTPKQIIRGDLESGERSVYEAGDDVWIHRDWTDDVLMYWIWEVQRFSFNPDNDTLTVLGRNTDFEGGELLRSQHILECELCL